MARIRHHLAAGLRLTLELFESRLCLTDAAFAWHDIECCGAEEPEAVVAVDLNGDGDLDVLFATKVNHKIAWYENLDGKGTFGNQRIIRVVDGAFSSVSVAAADLDGDGDQDVVWTAENLVGWNENLDGRGGFAYERRVATGSSIAVTVIADDVNGDGDLDLVVGWDNKIAWYSNADGSGTFGTEQIVAEVSQVQAIAVADVDNDHDVDVVAATSSPPTVVWFDNSNGKGHFGSAKVVSVQADATFSVAFGDLDSDGDVDIIAASLNEIAWFENSDGRGAFGTSRTIAATATIHALVVADLDGDTDLDLLAANAQRTDEGKIVWFENRDGQGAFGPERAIQNQIRGANLAIGDLDGDGDTDLLSTSYDHRVAWYANQDGQGGFGTQILISAETIGPNEVHPADLDGDGDVDVVVVSVGDQSIVWFENVDGKGSFGIRRLIGKQARRPTASFVADMDGDGDTDVVFASGDDHTIVWHENTDGYGNFGPERVIGTHVSGVFSMAAADLNGDGQSDVLSAAYDDDKISWYENIDGMFVEKVISLDAEGAQSIFAADLDGDSDLDVLSASRGDGKVSWYENLDGRGTFGLPTHIDVLLRPIAVIAADVDGDGDADILALTATCIAWYENIDGDGHFGVPRIIASPDFPRLEDIVAADMDQDGDIDVLSGPYLNNQTVVFENVDGQGSFLSTVLIGSDFMGRGRRSFAQADVDGDADVDVVIATFERIGWYEQRILGDVDGDGRFTTTDLILVFQAGEYEDQFVRNSSFAEGDWNGDSEFDSADLVLAFQGGKYELPLAASWQEGDWNGDGFVNSGDLVAAFKDGRYEQPAAVMPIHSAFALSIEDIMPKKLQRSQESHAWDLALAGWSEVD